MCPYLGLSVTIVSLPVWQGLRATVWREQCCTAGPPLPDVQVIRGSRDVFPALDGGAAAGRATREVDTLV